MRNIDKLLDEAGFCRVPMAEGVWFKAAPPSFAPTTVFAWREPDSRHLRLHAIARRPGDEVVELDRLLSESYIELATLPVIEIGVDVMFQEVASYGGKPEVTPTTPRCAA